MAHEIEILVLVAMLFRDVSDRRIWARPKRSKCLHIDISARADPRNLNQTRRHPHSSHFSALQNVKLVQEDSNFVRLIFVSLASVWSIDRPICVILSQVNGGPLDIRVNLKCKTGLRMAFPSITLAIRQTQLTITNQRASPRQRPCLL